jgi:LPS export ABC transporter protein LptC/lipopolysaccharide transport protein LptA
MTRWQKRARAVLAIVAAAVLTMVALTLRERRTPDTSQAVARLDPNAVAESAGGRMVQATGTRVPGVVDYERMMAYADGSARLIRPKITTTRNGQEFVVTGREGRVDKDQSNVAINGEVTLTSADGLRLTTGEATYTRSEGLVRAPGPVSFSKGAVSGTAVGMSYHEPTSVLTLLDKVVVKVAPGRDTGGGADITAGSLEYARQARTMRFERAARIVREGRTVEADAATARLSSDESRLERLELRGSSRITSATPGEGDLESMVARDMDLDYAADGETLEHALLMGGGAIVMAGSAGAAGRRLGGERMDIAFGPDGTMSNITAQDRVQLTMPAQQDTPERVIQSAAMQGTGTPGKGLTSARFTDGVEFQETTTTGTLRIARARTLDVAMAPATGAIEEAHFAGSTRFEEGVLRASAADGRYRVNDGRLELTGAEGPRDPRVQDDRITVDAKRIDLTFEGPVLAANGEVRSVLQPSKGNDAAKPAQGPSRTTGSTNDDRTVPGMLKDDQPVYVTGATLDYDGARSFATYKGNARLWQGDTTIQGDTIVLDEHSGDLQANGSVRSTFVLEQMDQKTQQPTKVPSIATSKDLHYEDAARRATYTTDAHVNGPQGDCHAERIELYFVEGGGSLDRAEAYRSVKLIADERTSTGDRMTYFAADERYIMVGAPVRIIEECRETTAKTLTFWRSTDRILADGNEEIRTLTRNGGTCAGQRFE